MNVRREARWQWLALWRFAVVAAIPITAVSYLDARLATVLTCLAGGARGIWLGMRRARH